MNSVITRTAKQYRIAHWPRFFHALILLIAGPFLIVMSVLIQQKAHSLLKLPVTSAVIAGTEVIEIDPVRNIHPAYQHRITYNYTTPSGTMTNPCDSYGGFALRWGSRQAATELLPAKGTETTVHYMPNSPSTCYDRITPNSPAEQFALLTFISIVAFGGGGLLFKSSVKRHVPPA